jgi:hypothetical protein
LISRSKYQKNDYLRWSFLKWRVDIESDVASFWKTNNSNFSSQIDFVKCFSFSFRREARDVRVCVCWRKIIDNRFRIKIFEFRIACRSLIRLYEINRHWLFWCSRIQKKNSSTKFRFSSFSFYFNLLCYSRLLKTFWNLIFLLFFISSKWSLLLLSWLSCIMFRTSC